MTRCSVVDGSMTIVEAARIFGLADDSAIYRRIERMEADEIANHVLHASLAYGNHIMSRSHAAELWQQFVTLFDGQDVEFTTNARGTDSWNPATQSTLDMGILVIGTSRVGCLWVEEED